MEQNCIWQKGEHGEFKKSTLEKMDGGKKKKKKLKHPTLSNHIRYQNTRIASTWYNG